MRRQWPFFLLGTLLAIPSTLPAQDDTLRTYRFNASVPVTKCTFDGVIVPNTTPKTPPPAAQFYYLKEVTPPKQGDVQPATRVVIQFLFWRDTTSVAYKTFNIVPAERSATPTLAQPELFCIDKSLLEHTASRIYAHGWSSWDLAAGVLLMPIKMRSGPNRPFDFSKDITVGTVAGPRFRLTAQREVYLSGLIGAGITAVTLNSENTRGKVTTSTDRAAVTLTLGPMLEVKRFQFGVMVGWDQISNPNQNDWIYQGKRWISVGLGYTLLSSPPSSPASGKQ